MGRPQSVEMALGGNAQQSGNATALAQRRGVWDTCEQMAEIVMRAMRLPLSTETGSRCGGFSRPAGPQRM